MFLPVFDCVKGVILYSVGVIVILCGCKQSKYWLSVGFISNFPTADEFT